MRFIGIDHAVPSFNHYTYNVHVVSEPDRLHGEEGCHKLLNLDPPKMDPPWS